MVKRILSTLKLLWQLNIPKTIYINFKMLPRHIALKLPIYVYGKAKFRETNGKIIIDAPIQRGMIKIGKNNYYVRTAVPLTYWVINGTINFNGNAKFLNGGYMCVSRNASITIGDNATIGSNYKIMCFENIKIGNYFRCAYDCQLYDTSFHYIRLDDNSVSKLTKPIQIGDCVWVGNTSSIVKGAVIPDKAIIASNSLVNKDFSRGVVESNKGCILAGIPAKIKMVGVERIYDNEEERSYDKQFCYDRTHL